MVDLNRLRDTIKQNQRQEDALPDDFWRKAFVDPNGKIHLGRDGTTTDGRPASEIHQGIFAAGNPIVRADTHALVQTYLPAGTELIEQDGVPGWIYDFQDEVGQWWQMFLFHDGSLYQVQVVSPELDGQGYNVHNAHLFSDGRICLSALGGVHDLRQAYAKSVLWASGFSVFRTTGQFPFSINNE